MCGQSLAYPSELTRAATVRAVRYYFIPDLALTVSLITLFYCLFLFHGYQALFRDSDAGWHIRTGESIQWTRVHNLPGFVYFDHSIHIRKGVGCSTCHGRVDTMPLTWRENTLYMDWCLECHRAPERYVRPRQYVFNMDYQPPVDQIALGEKLVKEYRIRKLTSCSTCHR